MEKVLRSDWLSLPWKTSTLAFPTKIFLVAFSWISEPPFLEIRWWRQGMCVILDDSVVIAHLIVYSTEPVAVFEETFIQIIRFPTINETKWDVVLEKKKIIKPQHVCLYLGLVVKHQFLGYQREPNFSLYSQFRNDRRIDSWHKERKKKIYINNLFAYTPETDDLPYYLVVFKTSEFLRQII